MVARFFIVIALAAFLTPSVVAQTPAEVKAAAEKEMNQNAAGGKKEEEGDPEVLGERVLSSQGKYKKTASADAPGTYGDEQNLPISANVTNRGSGRCSVTVSNSSKESKYATRLRVESVNERGKVVAKKNFSVTVGPGKTVERQVSCREGANTQATLRSGRKL